jgi:hypothetical protein
VYYDLCEESADLATRGVCPLGAPDAGGHRYRRGLDSSRNGSLNGYMREVGLLADAEKYNGAAWNIAKPIFERAPGRLLIEMSP